MSVILDVLKKLDREKPSRRDQPPNIVTEILRPDPPRSKRRIPLNIVIVSLTAIVTATITYVLIKESGFLSKPSPPLLPSPPGTSRQVRPAPLEGSIQKKSSPPPPVISPLPGQQVDPTPIDRETVREIKEGISKIVPKTEAVPESKATEAPKAPAENKTAIAPPEEKKTIQSVIPAKKDVAPVEPSKKSTGTPVSGSATGPPSLKISAIVWYEDPSMRFAIINGLKTVEGVLIEGVKVVEINRTSVRFLHNNQYFEVSILR